MSHFTVLVIGENPEKQLQPYHEYECTGIEDEYVIDVDKTDEVNEWLQRELFVGKTKKNGELDYQYHQDNADENLEDYKKMTRLDYINLKGDDVGQEIEDWHGFEKRNDKYFKRTNPNKKWDWYTLGGRWTGFFKSKLGVLNAVVGEPGLMTDKADEGYADQLLKSDIDFEYMRNEAENKALQEYNFAMQIFGDTPVNETWDAVRNRIEGIDNARAYYWSQPRCVAWKEKQSQDYRNFPFGFSTSPDDFMVSKATYLQNARNGAGLTFAVIKDGQWYEKGSMGWFGFVGNEKDQNVWNEQVTKMIDELPDDTLLSVYDCHI